MIPRVLHRIWLGNRPRPAFYDDYWQQWAALHPGWDLHTWTERSIPPLRNQAEYDPCAPAAGDGILADDELAAVVQRSHIAAYELVWRFGGVYVDCAMQPLRPLDELLDFPALAGLGDDRYMCNAVLGGEPRSPFFDAVISELPFRVATNPHAGVEVQTGPHLLTAIWREHPELIAVLPREAFLCAHHGSATTQVETARRAGAFAIHHWLHRARGRDLGVLASRGSHAR
ncbi:MAG: glycosyltransferase family 32 protein [Pseudonocardiaceae bacterium]